MDTTSNTQVLATSHGITATTEANGTTEENATYNNQYHYNANFTNITFVLGKPSGFEPFMVYYVVPTLALIGIVSNATTFILLIRPPMNGFSTSVYLAAYSAVCVIYWPLIVGLNWLFHVINIVDISLQSEFSCRIWSFVNNLLTYSPYWFLIGAAVDRLIALWCPQRAQYMCTVFMAKVGVALTVVFLTATAVHCMWTFNLHYIKGTEYCITRDIRIPHVEYGSLIIVAVLMYIPNILFFILGNLLVTRLCLKHHGRQIPNAISIDIDMTYSVTAITMMEFAMCTPSNVQNIANVYFSRSDDGHARYVLLQYITMLSYLVVFFILIVRSSDFRDSLLAMLKGQSLCSRRNSGIELRLMNDYNQVPSTSTSV